MDETSALEKVTGALPVEIAGTALAVAVPWPGALLPVLTNALAHGRAKKRIEDTLRDLNSQLEQLRDKVQSFSDAQYRLTGAIVAAIYETVDEEKLRLLKAAALNVANSDYLGSFDAQAFSRLFRDISPAEVRFLMTHQNAGTFSFASPRDSPSTVFIDKSSQEGLVAVSLINLGLLVRTPSEGLASDAGGYVMSPLVSKFLALLQE
jgi:hypothetical protein